MASLPLRMLRNVSIHARHCCRANHDGAARPAQQDRVSIHARHCCRANPTKTQNSSAKTSFQSTPGIAAGRIEELVVTEAACDLFQSTPGIAAGRIIQLRRQQRRARSFNPRPALLPGESLGTSEADARCVVSIHARHCCRANHRCPRYARSMRRFQSTPGIAAGRIDGVITFKDASKCFNPRPALLPGESRCSASSQWATFCFNPRPALLPGESVVPTGAKRANGVFQSTPGIAAGRIAMSPLLTPLPPVSIHARHCCRANREVLGGS